MFFISTFHFSSSNVLYFHQVFKRGWDLNLRRVQGTYRVWSMRPHSLDQCFSYHRPRYSGGPQDSFGGPTDFSQFIKNLNLNKNYQKSTISATKTSRYNKMCLLYPYERPKINVQKMHSWLQKCLR